ncbi:MAG: translation initiation factor IF-2 [bacterium]
MKKENQEQKNISRPPVVVVMGHIDHGKSTLLDYIRKTNVVDGETGGITQRLSAYEVSHKDASGNSRTITFLDTPGHEAFVGMRSRGAQSADIAILVVSAEDSVKTQTLEAWKTIVEYNLPYIVAINKIDKPNANPQKVKMDLAEKGIYLEGFGGDISFAEISAKVGTGIDHLLELVLLTADISELTGNPNAQAEGIVIESHLDPKRGISATLIVKNGTLKKGMFVRAGTAVANTRMMEDFRIKPMNEATLSQPVGIVGWSEMPEVGRVFHSYDTKSEVDDGVKVSKEKSRDNAVSPARKPRNDSIKKIPIIIRADTSGGAEAVLSEIMKLELPTVEWKIISCGVGNIGENDIKSAAVDTSAIIVGFNTKLDPRAREINEQMHVKVENFSIIYKLSEFLKDFVEERRPRIETTSVSGSLKVQKIFNKTKDRQVVGGLVVSGEIHTGNTFRIMRRENEIGEGTIVGLEQNKNKTKTVSEGVQCGVLVEARIDIAPGDILEAISKQFE